MRISSFLIVFPVLCCLLMIACVSDKETTDNPPPATTPIDSMAPDSTIIDSTQIDTTAQTEPVDDGRPYTYGIDISKYQGNEIDHILSHDSLSFVICKATEGITYTDPKFSHNWSTAKEEGIIRGTYHFYRSNDDPVTQAAHFLKAIGTIDKTDLSPVLDIEGGSIVGTIAKEKLQKDVLTFLDYIEKQTGRKPIVYTGYSFSNQYLNNPKIAEYPLWIAEYNNRAEPRLPNPWKGTKWVMWQKSDSYPIDAMHVDFDKFNGNKAAFLDFIANN